MNQHVKIYKHYHVQEVDGRIEASLSPLMQPISFAADTLSKVEDMIDEDWANYKKRAAFNEE